jgi:hypothetical protein
MVVAYKSIQWYEEWLTQWIEADKNWRDDYSEAIQATYRNAWKEHGHLFECDIEAWMTFERMRERLELWELGKSTCPIPL